MAGHHVTVLVIQRTGGRTPPGYGSTMVDSTVVVSRSIETAGRLGALADPVRLAIVGVLAGGERCVCDLQERVAVAPNLLSYHLRVLREAGLVAATRRGRWVDYRLDGAGFAALWAGAAAAGVPLPGQALSSGRAGPSCDDAAAPR
jgi:ArsR family transcriptional regulator, arsenate/arsenite/antimonite-responsive transcriptional repressor